MALPTMCKLNNIALHEQQYDFPEINILVDV